MQDQQPVGVTSVSLLARAKNKDQEAWQRIVELYAPLISFWCKRKHGLPEHVCDDITQDVLSQLLKSLPHYRSQSFRGYLRTMTRNKVTDWRRGEGRHQAKAAGGTTALRSVSQVADPYPEEEDEDGEQPTPTEQALLVRKAFEQMASRFDGVTMRVVSLVWLEGRRVKDVALSEHLSEAAVSGRLKRVKQAMAIELEGIVDL